MRGMDFIANEAVKNKPMFKELIELRFNELLLLILRNKRIHEQEGSNDYYSLELSGIAVEIAKYLEENYDKFIKDVYKRQAPGHASTVPTDFLFLQFFLSA